MRALILALIVASAIFVSRTDATEGGYVSFFKHASISLSEDKEGNFVAKDDGVTVTVLRPIRAETLPSSGAQVRIATTVAIFDPPQKLDDWAVVKKVTRVIYNCAKLEAFISSIILFDKDDKILFEDADISTVMEIEKNSISDEVRKHTCKYQARSPRDLYI